MAQFFPLLRGRFRPSPRASGRSPAVSGKHLPGSHAFRTVQVRRLGVLLRGKNPADRLVPVSVRRLRRKGGEGPQRYEREGAVGPSLEGRVVAVLGVLA